MESTDYVLAVYWPAIPVPQRTMPRGWKADVLASLYLGLYGGDAEATEVHRSAVPLASHGRIIPSM